jgi:hypothetical protein
MNSESGVYCGPLKLLASEVFHKTNAAVEIFAIFLDFHHYEVLSIGYEM